MAGRTAGQGEGREDHAVAFVVGALLGGVAGAAWTLFNAPRSGAETRAAIVRGVGAAVDGTREAVRETGERVADRLALAIDSISGGGADDWPEPPPVTPLVPTATGNAIAAEPTVGVNGSTVVVAGQDADTPPDPAESTGVGAVLDPGEVAAGAATPAGTTS